MIYIFTKRSLILPLLLVAVFVLGAIAGVWFRDQQHPAPIAGVINQDLNQPEGVDFSLFWDAWRVLQEKYPKELKTQEMVYGAISGMVNSLGDPYTVFMAPQETQRFEEDYIDGRFEGVGMEVGIRKNQLQVIAPLENTPAKKAGLMAGDKIVKINDKDSFGLTLDEAVNLIRGPKGTEVTLSILREDWAEPKNFSIIRDVIQIPTIKWELREGDIAYIQLYQFSQKALSDFALIAEEISNSPAESIILDLRNNPGGFLEVAQKIAGWFLEKDEVVTIEEFAKGNKQIYKSTGSGALLRYPIVILINQGSASASEILAGALRDNRGIKLIGEKSFGKGSVQELENLRQGASLKITVANWLTPKGELITDRGLEPDIKIEMIEENIAAKEDPQLDAAIEALTAQN